MKQTAVEWLEEEIEKRYGLTPTSILLFRDAKEMEKQQQDEFAIGFAKFSIDYNYHPTLKVWIRYDKIANEIFTTKELLEIYKKEKEL